jgi:hypothetical protein
MSSEARGASCDADDAQKASPREDGSQSWCAVETVAYSFQADRVNVDASRSTLVCEEERSRE